MSKYDSGKVIKDIQHQTRHKYFAKENLRIVLDGLQEEDSIAELCRREGSNQNVYYRWSKAFLKAGKQRLAGAVKPPGYVPSFERELYTCRGTLSLHPIPTSGVPHPNVPAGN